MDRLITFKTAELAKDKGLKRSLDVNGYLLGYSLKNEKPYPSGYKVFMSFPSEDKWLFAPTQSTLSNWLREEHSIDVLINKTISGVYYYIIWKGSEKLKPVGRFYKYEDCFEDGLFEALNLI